MEVLAGPVAERSSCCREAPSTSTSALPEPAPAAVRSARSGRHSAGTHRPTGHARFEWVIGALSRLAVRR